MPLPNHNLGQPVKNRFKVPLKQWSKWSNHAKKVFNQLYQAMRPSLQWAFLHPDAHPSSKAHWDTVRWNSAWTAADIANGDRPKDLFLVANRTIDVKLQKGLVHGKTKAKK